MKTNLSLIFVVVAFLQIIFVDFAKSEKITLDFKTKCFSENGESFFVQTILKRENSDSKQLIQLECKVKAKKCYAVEIRDLQHGELSYVNLRQFDYQVVSVSAESSKGRLVARRALTTSTLDFDGESVNLKVSYMHEGKELVESWRGRCGD
ncbi:MAG: hypothetical protein U1D69_09775 [Polynucleobacter sp.]|nr:hypothetical protein [Polynucleobacter sp.]